MIAAMKLLTGMLVWVLLAPLLPGIVNKVKAWMAGRRGPPAGQLYWDLMRLWHKQVVLSRSASPMFLFAPAIGWGALLGAVLLLVSGFEGSGLSFSGDVLAFVYLLALTRFCTAWAAMETGSAFEGMGAAREVTFAVLPEVAILMAFTSLAIQTDSSSLALMLNAKIGAETILLGAGLFIVLLVENARVPFDDPNTHLELTMVHEVMVLDHSGPPLALILHGAAIKLLLFSVLLVQVSLPLHRLDGLAWCAALGGGVLVVGICVGLVESLMARLAFRRVPMLLLTAVLLCLFAVLLSWKGNV